MGLYDYTIPDKGELFDTLLSHKNITIVRIVSSNDLEEMTYCQDEDEWVVVLEGEATLLLEKREVRLHKGDSLFIPSKTEHRVLSVQKGTLWLAIHIA